MSAVDNYILDLDEKYRSLVMQLHDIIMQNSEVSCAVKWSLPVYDAAKYFCYINTVKKKNCVELCFVQGFKFEDPYGLLEGREEKLLRECI